jgi:two-component system sensor histidine kinase KdpD
VLAKRADRYYSLFQIHKLALNKNTAEETIATLDEELKLLLQTDVVFFMPSLMDEAKLEALFKTEIELNENDLKALKICWEEAKTTGVGAPYSPHGCRWRFEPLITSQDEIGVLAVHINDNIELDADFGRLVSGIADQVALIIERMQLGHIAEETRIQAEREKLRAMLLSSVSHDLKTPLASVIGSLSVYRSMGANLPEEHKLTLINTALEEAQRLDSFITNILDMTRIESGQIELKQEWVSIVSLIETVRKRLRDRLRHHTIIVLHQEDIEVSMDEMMTGQVLQNLLDNAAKYTTHGTQIEISWQSSDDGLELAVRDNGAGIPESQHGKVFDKYARINRQDSQVAGTGLGLAIARAVMRAQGGNIMVANHPQGGAVFKLIFPRTRKITQQEAA